MAAEWIILIALVILTVFIVVGVRARKIPRRFAIGGMAVASLVLPVAIAILAVSYQVDVLPAEPVVNRPIEFLSNGYVGSDSCLKCHPSQHASWHDSYHRTMTQIADPEIVLGDFDVDPIELGDNRYHFGKNDRGAWVDVTSRNEPLVSPNTERWKLVMTTGSHHMQGYWFSIDDDARMLGMIPFLWNRETKRWLAMESSFLRAKTHKDETEDVIQFGRWNEGCLHCHATGSMPGAPEGKESEWRAYDTRAAEFGISCEACHGPGEQHVALHRNPVSRYNSHLTKTIDSSIVNPAKLDHERSSQVCGRCHSVFGPRTMESWRKIRQTGYSAFQPGGNLHDSPLRYIFECCQPTEEYADPLVRDALDGTSFIHDRFWSDGMVRVTGCEYNGIRGNGCFTAGEMSCLSCHKMHQTEDDPRPRSEWTDDQLDLHMNTNQACVQCHEELGDDAQLAAHTNHQAASSGSSCYNCHMSYTTYGLLKAIRSHQIDSPSVATSLETGRPNACNQCHLDKTLAWTANHLEDWYGIERPELNEDETNIAASILWTLKGDAGQRALMAWNLGWTEAHAVSGTDWILPYLAELMIDPYDAIKFIAERSIGTIEGEAPWTHSGLMNDYKAAAIREVLHDIWQDRFDPNTQRVEAELLTTPEGIDHGTLQRLLNERDHTIYNLHE